MKRPLALVLVVLAMALAGCGALSGGEPTRSAFDLNGTTPLHGIEFDPENDRMPPGDDLYRAHHDSLADASYTVRYESVTRVNGSVVHHASWHLQYARDHDRYLQVTRIDGLRNRTFATYANGTHVWRKTTRDNGTAVNLLRTGSGVPVTPESTRAGVPQSFLRSLLHDVENPEIDEQTPASTASARYRITSDELDGRDRPNVSASVSMTVTEDGRVTRLDYAFERVGPNGTRAVEQVSLRYLQVNATTVERPDWVPTSGENASANETTTTDLTTGTVADIEAGLPSTTTNRRFVRATRDRVVPAAGPRP